MGKNKEELARREGMSYALKIAKEKGIDELEKDLKKRMAFDIPVRLSAKTLEEFSERVKNNVVDTFVILTAVTLHDEFGFGQKRVQQFIDRFTFKADCLNGDFTTWQEQIDILKEEIGINLKIRENNNDYKVK